MTLAEKRKAIKSCCYQVQTISKDVFLLLLFLFVDGVKDICLMSVKLVSTVVYYGIDVHLKNWQINIRDDDMELRIFLIVPILQHCLIFLLNDLFVIIINLCQRFIMFIGLCIYASRVSFYFCLIKIIFLRILCTKFCAVIYNELTTNLIKMSGNTYRRMKQFSDCFFIASSRIGDGVVVRYQLL